MAKRKGVASRTSRPDVSVCRRSQEERLLAVLRQARTGGTTVAVPRLLQMGLAHFGWRIFALRCRGFEIRNRMSRRRDGTTISEYELVFDPEKDV